MKFLFGYPRFTSIFSLMLSNVMRGIHPVYNNAALLCVVACVAAEIMEDFVVWSEIIPYSPPPGLKNYAHLTKTDPTQLYTIEKQYEGEEKRLGPAEGSKNSSKFFESMKKLYARKPCERALPLHGLRRMKLIELGSIIIPAVCFTPSLMQLLLGVGYVAGICNHPDAIPIPAEERVMEAFYWAQPLDCYCKGGGRCGFE